MNKINNPSQFNPEYHIGYFTGKRDYDDALKEAKDWAERNKVELVAYFEQKAFGKSILVSYRGEER